MDNLGNSGRYLIGVLHRKQVGSHSLVNRILLLAVLVGLHQLQSLWPYAVDHPLTHLRRPDAGDRALGDLGHDLLDFDQLIAGELDGGVAQGNVHQHATVVNPLVDVVVGQLVSTEGAQGFADGTHRPHVLLAVGNHLGHERGVFFEWGYAQQADQLGTSVVFLHGRASKPANVLQRTRRAIGAGLCCGADKLL